MSPIGRIEPITLHTLTWIVGSSLAMSAIAWVGLASVALNEEPLKKLLLRLVAFSAWSLLGGALLHLLPEAVDANGPGLGRCDHMDCRGCPRGAFVGGISVIVVTRVLLEH